MKIKAIVFSSTESFNIARAFSNALTTNAFDTEALNKSTSNEYEGLECKTWNDLSFKLGSYVRTDLERFANEYDFALFIFNYEDYAQIQHKTIETGGKLSVEDCQVTRDNVIFELGLISGIIGAERCIIIDCFSDYNPDTTERPKQQHLPSDIIGVTNVKFNRDSDNRADNIYHCLSTKIVPHMVSVGKMKRIDPDLMSQIYRFGLSAFYTNRNDFQYRTSENGRRLIQLKDYLNIAEKSIKIVAFTLAQGVIYGEAGKILKAKVEGIPNFTVTISLLNPFEPLYYSSCYLSLDRKDPDELIGEAKDSIKLLREFRNELSAENRARFNIKLHNTAKFEAAVLIDDNENNGRIQVEIKPYRVNVFDAYSFEVRKAGSSEVFYNNLKGSYDDLLGRAANLDDIRY